MRTGDSDPAHPAPKVSVVLPVYQEQDAIRGLVEEIVATLGATGDPFEVIVVDDGSEDGTLLELRALHSRFGGHLRVARHLYNRGNGAALRTGLRLARGEVVVTLDADGQHSPGQIIRLTSLIPPYDLVIGSRTGDYRGPWHRRFANRFFNWLASWLSRRRVEDLTSGFRAMRREVALHFLPLFPDGFSAPTTTTLAFLKAGYNVGFLPVEVGRRAAGRSKIRPWSDGMEFVTLILRIVALYDPLRIFLPTGAMLALLGVAGGVAGIINAGRLVLANSAILMFLAAIFTWLLGLVASQVASTMIHYHGDETVLVDEQALGHPEPSIAEGTLEEA